VWVGRPDNAAVPGLVGRLVAAPILFDAFARLGIEADPAPAPRGTIHSSNTDLPPPLRHLRQDVPKTASSLNKPRLRIAFPPDGARLEWTRAEAEAGDPVLLKALGGAGPFTWLVDGRPVAGPQSRRFADWKPEGRGFARVSVIDADGSSDSVLVRVQ
jgi:penicillin-binding protein 1C